jgi:hypothetical protein
MKNEKLAQPMAALATALVGVVVGILCGGCAVKFEARLFDPLNRPISGNSEAAMVARARHLLAGGLSPDEVTQNLQATGQTEEEARRIVALAQKGK